ncbi:MAG: YceI family protein [Crocinitomicaceae bacterium]|nr:YceI family protein [Crocinitomicaceae bacterium]MBK8926722.1 YceI family protein [Crocinitomicaceae bacterium]
MNYLALAFYFATSLSGQQELDINLSAVKIEFTEASGTSGTIGGFAAGIKFDPADLTASTISGTVEANTLNTENSTRDKHLQSKDFFEVETFPQMSFKSTSIQAEGSTFVMTGTLQIKDVSREEKITFTYDNKLFSGSSTIQLKYYNVGGYTKKKPEQTNVDIKFHIPIL